MELLINNVSEIKTNQDKMCNMLEMKIGKWKDELIGHIDSKVKMLYDELSIDISAERVKIDQVINSVQVLEDKMLNLEEDRNQLSHGRPTEDNDLTVVLFGVKFEESENILEKAHSIIQALGEHVFKNVDITEVIRMKSRLNTKPGIVKISFVNTEQRNRVLQFKRTLAETVYKDVFISRAKSQTEILIESNSRTII
ncbi:hypothetical protein SNE40_009576 [Patella caerulea]|uniref:Uncharacterized protein n=1 Tax=Patella caerulea TaxID=87958 RepID=A0AAN8JSG5_PATCE